MRPHAPSQFYPSASVILPFPFFSGRLLQLRFKPFSHIALLLCASPSLSTFKDRTIPHLDQRISLLPALPVSGLLTLPFSPFSSLLPKLISKILLRLGNSATSPPPRFLARPSTSGRCGPLSFCGPNTCHVDLTAFCSALRLRGHPGLLAFAQAFSQDRRHPPPLTPSHLLPTLLPL